MESKKNPSRDVHRMYPLTLTVGLLLSIALVIAAFELKFKYHLPPRADPWDDALAFIHPIVIPETTVHARQREKPPARIVTQVPSVIEVASAETEPEPELQQQEPFEQEPLPAMAEVLPVESDETVTYAEEMPVPEDGLEGFYKLLRKELRYPRAAVVADVQGRVFVESSLLTKKEMQPQ